MHFENFVKPHAVIKIHHIWGGSLSSDSKNSSTTENKLVCSAFVVNEPVLGLWGSYFNLLVIDSIIEGDQWHHHRARASGVLL